MPKYSVLTYQARTIEAENPDAAIQQARNDMDDCMDDIVDECVEIITDPITGKESGLAKTELEKNLLAALKECVAIIEVAFASEENAFGVHHNDATDAYNKGRQMSAKAEGRD